MYRLFIKSFWQFKTGVKTDMIFRRVWFHRTGEELLDRRILKVQTNGFFVEDLDARTPNDVGLWCEWGKSTDWKFKNGKVYMIFNHEADYEKKENSLTPKKFKDYQERYKNYLQNDLPNGLVVDGYKVLAIYEVWVKGEPPEEAQ